MGLFQSDAGVSCALSISLDIVAYRECLQYQLVLEVHCCLPSVLVEIINQLPQFTLRLQAHLNAITICM